ncbi:MAG: hypothetical protein FWH22_04675, partial [Fibromonadales bacterium]|nr:hypothetical protein [Fibromonadales bacterium]
LKPDPPTLNIIDQSDLCSETSSNTPTLNPITWTYDLSGAGADDGNNKTASSWDGIFATAGTYSNIRVSGTCGGVSVNQANCMGSATVSGATASTCIAFVGGVNHCGNCYNSGLVNLDINKCYKMIAAACDLNDTRHNNNVTGTYWNGSANVSIYEEIVCSNPLSTYPSETLDGNYSEISGTNDVRLVYDNDLRLKCYSTSGNNITIKLNGIDRTIDSWSSSGSPVDLGDCNNSLNSLLNPQGNTIYCRCSN